MNDGRDVYFIAVGFGLGVVLSMVLVGVAHADRPSFLDQSVDKTIIYGKHGTAETKQGTYGQGTDYIYPQDTDRDCDDCEDEDSEEDLDTEETW